MKWYEMVFYESLEPDSSESNPWNGFDFTGKKLLYSR